MASRRPGSLVVAGGLGGLAGVVVAHALDYLALFPDGGARARELAATGHNHWPVSVAVAAAGAAAAVVVGVARGLRRATEPPPGPGASLLWVVAGCAAWQAVLFASLEAAERLSAGQPAGAVLHERVFWAGLAAQVPVAALVAVVLRLVEGGAARMARPLRAAVSPGAPVGRPLLGSGGVLRSRRHGTVHSRAPPPALSPTSAI